MNTESKSITSFFQIFMISLKLGLTSFGGPVAHLGYFHNEYIQKRKWLDDKSYADLVALCQFLPGPASSQVGIGIGIMRGGLVGGLAAFLGFTLPSVIALVIFAYFVGQLGLSTELGWLKGLKIVAVVIVLHAVLGMGQKLIDSKIKATIAILATIAVLLIPTSTGQISVIIIAALLGFFLFKHKKLEDKDSLHIPISKTVAMISLFLFFAFLFLLPIIKELTNNSWIILFDHFYRAGSLVFGGGHVVLPLLERELVPTGLISKEAFLAGYGAAQAVPGPLFTFAAYLGAIINGWKGATVATIAIFLPAFLLVVGSLPFWHKLRSYEKVRGVLDGVNAAVVGILLAALYDPIFTSSILSAVDFGLAAFLFLLLNFWKVPAWVIVIVGLAGGTFISLF